MALQATKLTPRIGVEVKTDKAALLTGAHAGELRALLDRYGVVIARDIGFDDEEEMAFGATLGMLRQEFGHPIMKVTLDKRENPEFADYFVATSQWHMDGTHEDVPPLASILTPRVLAPWGGETEFANMYAAYEDLPEADKTLFGSIRIVHTKLASIAHTLDNPSEADIERLRSYGSKVHPAVWEHRSGRRSIVMSASADHVVGMDPVESAALIRRIKEWCEQPRYVYQHRWRMGDLLIWDNTGTTHRVCDYDHDCGRRLHRVTLLGEERLTAAA